MVAGDDGSDDDDEDDDEAPLFINARCPMPLSFGSSRNPLKGLAAADTSLYCRTRDLEGLVASPLPPLCRGLAPPCRGVRAPSAACLGDERVTAALASKRRGLPPPLPFIADRCEKRGGGTIADDEENSAGEE